MRYGHLIMSLFSVLLLGGVFSGCATHPEPTDLTRTQKQDIAQCLQDTHSEDAPREILKRLPGETIPQYLRREAFTRFAQCMEAKGYTGMTP